MIHDDIGGSKGSEDRVGASLGQIRSLLQFMPWNQNKHTKLLKQKKNDTVIRNYVCFAIRTDQLPLASTLYSPILMYTLSRQRPFISSFATVYILAIVGFVDRG